MPIGPELAADAALILDRADVPHGEIISIDRDSILFRGPKDEGVFTAWLHVRPTGMVKVVMVEIGFSAEPPEGLHETPRPRGPLPTSTPV